MPTTAQTTIYNLHRAICHRLNVGQSTFRHKSLQGTLSPPSATGNVVYAGPGPRTDDPPTTDTLVWAVWQEQNRVEAGEVTAPARMAVGVLRGQFPTIDDAGNVVEVEHDDWLDDPLGRHYRVMNPVLSPDAAYWSFSMKRER